MKQKEPFNAKASRAKRPLPLWVDAIVADTAHLEADEYGSYVRILQTMWRRESCDLPLDHRKLAVVAGVSPRLWKSRIWPSLEGYFRIHEGMLHQKRLREEAAYVERQVTAQSNRKVDEKSDKALNYYDPTSSADDPRNDPRYYPSYNLHKEEEEEGYAHAREAPSIEEAPPPEPPPPEPRPPTRHPADKLLGDVMDAVGIRGPTIPTYWMPPAATLHVGRWKSDLGLTEEEILAVARNSRDRHPDPPGGPKALDRLMQALAAEKARPAMQLPATGEPNHGRRPVPRDDRKSRAEKRAAAWLAAVHRSS